MHKTSLPIHSQELHGKPDSSDLAAVCGQRPYKNVIFDCSDTLLHWAAKEYLCELLDGDAERAERLHQAIFYSEQWLSFDYGKCTHEENKQAILAALPPEDRAVADIYLEHWQEHYRVIEGMPEIIDELKSRGIKLYLLSNYSDRFEQCYARYELLHRFDGQLISYTVGTGKDDPEFFKMLLKKYDLKAEECIYFDDYPRFVKVARTLGIDGHHFIDAASTRALLGI